MSRIKMNVFKTADRLFVRGHMSYATWRAIRLPHTRKSAPQPELIPCTEDPRTGKMLRRTTA